MRVNIRVFKQFLNKLTRQTFLNEIPRSNAHDIELVDINSPTETKFNGIGSNQNRAIFRYSKIIFQGSATPRNDWSLFISREHISRKFYVLFHSAHFVDHKSKIQR